jgi:hypothetical protein
MERSFSARLVVAKTGSGMTDSDLARWFMRPRATVNTWVNGRTPFGPPKRLAEKRLALLEWSLRVRTKYWPVADHLSWTEREKYVRGMRDDAERNCRVPELRATA